MTADAALAEGEVGGYGPRMRRRVLATVVASMVASMVASGCAAGCGKDAPPPAQSAAPIPEVTVDELAALLARQACVPVDANGARTRERQGVIPGAVLLTDSAEYLPSELPGDKAMALVFYCTNEACSASHEAAARARLAGYPDVRVLPAGIAGWKKAGQPTQAI